MLETFKKQFIYESTLSIENKIQALKKSLNAGSVDALTWYEKEKLTSAQYDHLKRGDVDQFQKLVSKQIQKEEKKKEILKNEALRKIEEMESAGDLESLEISVEWKRSRTWGYNPTARVRVHYTGAGWMCGTDRASGCGYDKESAAVAGAFRDMMKPFILKNFETLKSSSIYGVCSNHLDFEGGVGMSCFVRAFKACGYNVHESHGDMYDVYMITKA